MSKAFVALSGAVLLSLAFTGAAAAADMSTDPVQVVNVVSTVDNEAAQDGAPAVVQRLESTFSVTAAQISALQAQGLGYGEIAIVFSLAKNMTGGITDANISQIMGLRQGTPPMGWGQIANSLGVNLGSLVSTAARVKGASESAGANAQGVASAGGHMSVGRGK